MLMISTVYDVFLHKQVTFWDCNKAAPHSGGIIPQKPQFGAGIGIFKPNSLKYQHLHIIQSTASTPTKFCTVLNTTKTIVFVGGSNMLITNRR